MKAESLETDGKGLVLVVARRVERALWRRVVGANVGFVVLIVVAFFLVMPAPAAPFERQDIVKLTLVVVLAAIPIAAILGMYQLRRFTRPLEDVESALRHVREGDLDVSVEVSDGGELGHLQLAVNEMVTGLRERQRLHDLFSRHVGPEVARHALAREEGLGGEARDATAIFVDLIGSTALGETRSPSDVLVTLNLFFAVVTRVVADAGGHVNKFHGDGALCIFGAPDIQPDHAARALVAARDIRAAVEKLKRVDPTIDAGIGIASGTVVAGNVGGEDRYEYTVIGDPVNEASRLCDEAKARRSRLLSGEGAIIRSGPEAGWWRHAGALQLRGRTAPTVVYELGVPPCAPGCRSGALGLRSTRNSCAEESARGGSIPSHQIAVSN